MRSRYLLWDIVPELNAVSCTSNRTTWPRFALTLASRSWSFHMQDQLTSSQADWAAWLSSVSSGFLYVILCKSTFTFCCYVCIILRALPGFIVPFSCTAFILLFPHRCSQVPLASLKKTSLNKRNHRPPPCLPGRFCLSNRVCWRLFSILFTRILHSVDLTRFQGL